MARPHGNAPLTLPSFPANAYIPSYLQTRPATLKIFRCPKINASTPEAYLSPEEVATFLE